MRGLHIQRPIMVTEKQKMYGDVFYPTQTHQHAYECVQPLQGLITFTEPEYDENGKITQFHRNNLSNASVAQSKAPESRSWDSVIYAMLVLKIILGVVMLIFMDQQTAYNDIYMTNFKFTSPTYSVERAGITKPLHCLLIALSLVVFSVIIGLTSSQKYLLDGKVSGIIFLVLLILQIIAFGLHVLMLLTQSDSLDISCLTIWGMLILHLLTFILSIVGLLLLMLGQPKSSVAAQETRIQDNEEKKRLSLKNYESEKAKRLEFVKRHTPKIDNADDQA
jgi:hypothetical protein